MFKECGLFRHRPMIRLKKKQEGILFTVPMIISVAILLAIIFVCVFAPLISPYLPTEQNLADSLALPSRAHLLGADKVGRDLLTRLFYGGRTTLLSAIGVVLFSMVVGIPLGLVSGYYRGPLDTVIGRICDLILSFPSLLLAFVFVAGFGRSIVNAVVALGIRRDWPETAQCGVVFFTLFLYTKFFDWWWDWMPKYLFFFLVGLTALLVLIALRRMRAARQRQAEAAA